MADFQELGLRFVPVNDAAANKALTDVAVNSEKAETATKRMTATQQSAANAQRMVAEANRLNTSALGQMAQAIQAADAAQRAALASTKNLGAAVQTAAAQAKAASVSFNTFYDAAERDFATQYVRQAGKTAAASKLMGHEVLNLTRQFSDIGVTAAMGMSPLMILIQQGPQIGETLSMAKARGVSFSAALREMAVAGWAAVAPLAPFILAAGAVAAVLGGGLLLATKELNDQHKDLAKGLGLTEEQLKKVKNEGITAGDVLKGTFLAAGAALKEAFAPQLEWLSNAFSATYQFILKATLGAVEGIVKTFGGAIGILTGLWKNFPAIVGDAVVSGANLALAAVEKLVNGAIGLLNKLIGQANALSAKVGGPQFSSLANASVGRIANGNAGALSNLAADQAKGEAAALAGLAGAYKAVEASIIKVATARIREEAGTAKATKAVNDNTAALKAAKDATDEFADSVNAFNKAAAERNRLAEQFAAFTPKTVDDPILVATAGKSAFDADALNRYADQVDQVARHTQTAAQGMAEAFGGVGKAVGDLVTVLANYDARQADIAARRADEHARYTAALADQNKKGAGWAKAELDWTHAQEMAARESAQARIRHYGDMATAAQGFFKEGTIGYSVMGAAEKAFRLIEFAMSAKSIAVKAFETAAKIGLFGAEAAAAAGAGAAAIFAAMGPFGFPVVAAMVATLAGLGVALSGGGGGGAVPGANDMANRQASQGTGSVLGDASAQSASLQNSMKIAEANWNKDLEYSNGMLKALRSIDGNMGALAASIARTLGTGGALSTDSLGLGTTGRPATLGNLGFGNTTTKTLQDQGLSFGAQNIGDILASGIQGETFQQTLSTTIKKAFGITYSNKSSTTTTTAALDADLSRQITDVIKSLRAGVLSAAGILGVTGAEATLDAFTVNLGKLSFKDMKGDEIQAALNGIFGKLGDDLAATAIPALTDLQKVGEGAFETLVRVARQYQVVDTSLQSIGMTFGAVGVASLAARERLVDLSGGIDAFAEGTSFFAENFLTEAERMAPIQKAVTTEFGRLGLAADLTRDQFKALVLGLDVSTEAGAGMYAALLNVAPAFDKVLSYTDGLAASAKELADSKANEVLKARADIEKQLFELTHSSVEIRDAERTATLAQLAALDATLPEQMARVYALQDEAAATVVANEALAKAAQIAADAGIPTFTVRLGEHSDRPAWDSALTAATAAHSPDLIVSAGFMKILGREFLSSFPGRVVNTHPALLPAFPGAHAVPDALDYGVKVTGCTVHVVDSGVDTGPILAQQAVVVNDDDDEETLHERIKVVDPYELPTLFKAVREETETHSPSRVFERIGKGWVDGAVLGVEGGHQRLSEVMIKTLPGMTGGAAAPARAGDIHLHFDTAGMGNEELSSLVVEQILRVIGGNVRSPTV